MQAILTLYIVSLVYSVIRYVAFTPQNLENLPVFIVNKGVAMAAALSFAFGFLQQMRKMRGRAICVEPATWFRAGVFGAIMHVPISLAILTPGYFPEFFGEKRLSFAGEMVFLFGGLTAAMIFLLLRPTWDAVTRWWLSLGAMVTLFAHVVAMGYARGLNMNISHAYMPPMWLLSAIGIAAAICWLLGSRPGGTEGTQEPKRLIPPRG